MNHLSAYFPWCLLSDEDLVSGRRFPALPTLCLCSVTLVSLRLEKHKPQADPDWTLCWCCGPHFHLCESMGNPLLIQDVCDRVPWFLFPGMLRLLPIHHSYLHWYYIGTESHLGTRTHYSPTAIVQMTAWGQVSGKVFHPVLHDTSTDLIQSTFEQKGILELESVGSEVWGSCAGCQSKELACFFTRKDISTTILTFQ